MILAGLLTPSDFGIVAAATLVVTLAQVVVGLGMGAAVVQRQTEVEEAASIAFGLSVAMAALLYGALWWLSPVIANFYQIPALVAVIRVASLSLLLSALVSIPTALLQRRLDFQRLFWIGAVPQIVTASASVALALSGGGYWALVIGQLVGLAINVALVGRASAWRPKRIFDGALARSLLVFGLWIMASSFQSWLFLYGDNAIAGYFFGAQGLGVYALGFNIANLLPGMIAASLSTVAYPAFCALQHEGARAVGLNLLKVQATAAIALAPICFGLSAVAGPLVSLLYGDKWPGLGMVIQWLVIMPGLSNLWSLNADAYRAINHPEVWTKVAAISLLILVPLLIVAGTHGPGVFVAARFISAFTLPVFNIWATTRVLRISIGEQMRSLAAPFGLTIIMYAVVLIVSSALLPFEGPVGWAKLAAVVLAGVIVYAASLRLIRRDLYQQLIASVRRVLLPA